MREYGFPLTHILPFKDKICYFPLYGRTWVSKKNSILVYFMECMIIQYIQTTNILWKFIFNQVFASKYFIILVLNASMSRKGEI